MDPVTSYNFRPINQTKWGPKADFVPLSKMGDWKYNLLIDGTVAAYRAPYLFQHETLVLKQSSGKSKFFIGECLKSLLLTFFCYF